MTIINIVIWIIVGIVVGWIASYLLRGKGLGIPGNIIVGVIGGFLGTWLSGYFGITSSISENIGASGVVAAFLGAIVTIMLVAAISRASFKRYLNF